MQQRSEETRSRILAAALECFSHSGYDATGVAEICAAAGVSKGAFYHHFPSKQALFIDLLNGWLAALDERFNAVREAAGSVPAALREMARAARQVFADARGQVPLFFEFWTQANRDPIILDKTLEPYRRYQEYFAGLVQSGMDEGSLRPVDPQAAARVIIALAVGLLAQGMATLDNPGLADTAEEGIEMLLRGIEN
jgi:AcrR family transcriptional regulator